MAQAAPRPNVLVIETDDQRLAGTMAVLDETRGYFFKRGVSFPHSVVTTPLCCPSRVSFLSGRYAHNHGVFHNGNAAELGQFDHASSLPALLQANGYATGIVGRYLNGWGLEPPPFFDRWSLTLGNYLRSQWSFQGSERTAKRHSMQVTSDEAVGFLRRQEANDGRPWFLWVTPAAPHAAFRPDGSVGFDPEPRYARVKVGGFEPNPATREARRPGGLADKPPFWRELVQAQRDGGNALPGARETRSGQLRLLLSVDDLVARLIGRLKRSGEQRRTLAIFTSDNGLFWASTATSRSRTCRGSPRSRSRSACAGPGTSAAVGRTRALRPTSTWRRRSSTPPASRFRRRWTAPHCSRITAGPRS